MSFTTIVLLLLFSFSFLFEQLTKHTQVNLFLFCHKYIMYLITMLENI
jgi:hypothetical protein